MLAAGEDVFYGFGEIKMSGSDVVVMSAQTALDGNMPLSKSKITYANGSKTDVTYGIRLEAEGTLMQSGRASATHFTSRFSDGNGEFKDAQMPETCKARDKKWISSWKASLYDEDGNRLQLANGPFQFKIKGKTVNERGQINNRNVWFDDELEGMKLSPLNPSLTVIRNDTGSEVVLNMVPYFMEKTKLVPFAPTVGDKFEGGGGDNNTRGVWDGTKLVITRAGNPLEIDEVVRVYSTFYDAEYVYTPKRLITGATKGAFQEIVRVRVTAKDYPEGIAEYKCFGDWGCPHIEGAEGRLSWTLENYMGLGEVGGDFNYDSFELATHGMKIAAGRSGTKVHTYFMTPLDQAGAFKPGTLYYDNDDGGTLNTADKALEFKFNVSNVYNDEGQSEKQVVKWGEATAAKWELAVDSNVPVRTPHMHAQLIPVEKVIDKTCGLNTGGDRDFTYDFWNCPHTITWQAGSWSHDNTIYATQGVGGSIVPIDPEKKFTYTTAIKDDLNCNPGADGDCKPLLFPARFRNNQWIEWLNKPCSATISGADGSWNAESQTCDANLAITGFNNQKITVGYDGELRGLPGYYDVRLNQFFRLANPKDGTKFTEVVYDQSEPKEYAYKALGIDEMYLPILDENNLPLLTACDTIKITAVPTNNTNSDLPQLTNKIWVSPTGGTAYSMPSQTWNEKPTIASTNTCEVASGIASSGCDS